MNIEEKRISTPLPKWARHLQRNPLVKQKLYHTTVIRCCRDCHDKHDNTIKNIKRMKEYGY